MTELAKQFDPREAQQRWLQFWKEHEPHLFIERMPQWAQELIKKIDPDGHAAAFEKANNGMRPNFMAVAAYDGMALVYKTLEKTKGDASGDALLAAMKGMSWMSPRGPVSIDPETRDMVQNIYVRKVEKKDGALYNVEFATIPDVKDPYKAAKH